MVLALKFLYMVKITKIYSTLKDNTETRPHGFAHLPLPCGKLLLEMDPLPYQKSPNKSVLFSVYSEKQTLSHLNKD